MFWVQDQPQSSGWLPKHNVTTELFTLFMNTNLETNQ